MATRVYFAESANIPEGELLTGFDEERYKPHWALDRLRVHVETRGSFCATDNEPGMSAISGPATGHAQRRSAPRAPPR